MMLSMRLKRLTVLYLFCSLQVSVAAQNCYYPNGDLSTTDAPCSSEEGAACCPLNWQCLDNGLCYLDNEKYFGRYTCTDQSWQSSACPGYCTTNKTDFGAQAVQQCSNHGGQYCCDQNRDVNNVCCNRKDDSLFFSLPDGNPTASIAKLGAPAAASGGSNNNNNNNNNPTSFPDRPPTTSTNPPSPPRSSDSTTSISDSSSVQAATLSPTTPDTQNQVPNRPSTTTSQEKTITRSSTASTNGITSLVLLTSIITTPAPVPQTTSSSDPSDPSISSSNPDSNSSPSAAIIGGAVGGGVFALLAFSLAIFLFLSRRKRRKQDEWKDATVRRSRSYLADQKRELDWMYKGQEAGKGQSGGEAEAMGTSSEIDGREVGFVRGNGGRRPGEVTRVEGFGGRVGREGGEGGGDPGPGPNVPRDKWEAYELAADGR